VAVKYSNSKHLELQQRASELLELISDLNSAHALFPTDSFLEEVDPVTAFDGVANWINLKVRKWKKGREKEEGRGKREEGRGEVFAGVVFSSPQVRSNQANVKGYSPSGQMLALEALRFPEANSSQFDSLVLHYTYKSNAPTLGTS
jgi:hypothetical protein